MPLAMTSAPARSCISIAIALLSYRHGPQRPLLNLCETVGEGKQHWNSSSSTMIDTDAPRRHPSHYTTEPTP